MARIVDLVVKDSHGNWSSLGIAENEKVDELVKKYHEITEAQGVLKKGKQEVKLSEMRLLATKTGGGELKAVRRFYS